MNDRDISEVIDSVASSLKEHATEVLGADATPEEVAETLVRMVAQEIALLPLSDALRGMLRESVGGGG